MEENLKSIAILAIVLIAIMALVYRESRIMAKQNKDYEEKRKTWEKKVKETLAIGDIEQVNDPDGLTCFLKIPVIMPEEDNAVVEIEDKVTPDEYEPEETANVKHLGNGVKEVIFESPPLYLGRIMIITAVVGNYENDPVEKEFVIK